MERPVRAKLNTQIYEEASEWFIECRAGDLDEAARREFDRWLRKSPEHQSAYLEIAAIWNEGPTLDPANRWDLDTLIVQAAEDAGNIVALERARATGHTPQPIPQLEGNIIPSPREGGGTGPRRKSVRFFAAVASILLVTAALAIYLLAPSGVYATALGEQRSLALSDGSTVQLNSLSKVRIRYTDHVRGVEIVQGQALFHIAKDTGRPFVVYSGPTRVRAVGTQFDVYRKTSGTIITVVEGRVAILGAGTAPPRDHEGGEPDSGSGTALVPRPMSEDRDGAILLTAGEQITVTAKAARRTLHPNLAEATAWTKRQLVFDSASLTEVADEFNRYNERKLVINPSGLGALHISGVFSSTDPASLIRFLRDRPGLRVTETPTQIRVEKVW